MNTCSLADSITCLFLLLISEPVAAATCEQGTSGCDGEPASTPSIGGINNILLYYNHGHTQNLHVIRGISWWFISLPVIKAYCMNKAF